MTKEFRMCQLVRCDECPFCYDEFCNEISRYDPEIIKQKLEQRKENIEKLLDKMSEV